MQIRRKSVLNFRTRLRLASRSGRWRKNAVMGALMLGLGMVALLPFYLQTRIDTTKRPPGRLLVWLHKTIDSWDYSRGFQWAVFYNIYIPIAEEDIKNAIGIVNEQINQIGVASRLINQTVTVYFNTIGNPNVLTERHMDTICRVENGITCRHLAHYEQAHEEVSLQALYDYCASSYYARVVYMHSKGSFHRDFQGQDRWRRHMMNATTSEMCLKPPNSTCDICGLLFQPLPAPHFTGNIWTAQCSYVQRLLPPKSFAIRMNKLTNKFISYRHKHLLNTSFFNQAPNTMGRERYSMEYWLSSHPSMRPCDVANNPNLSYWLTEDRDPSEFEFAMAPRFDINSDWFFYQYGQRGPMTLHNESLRMRDYFLLPGQLMRWINLYNRIPVNDSWVWRWFPDGEKWRDSALRYGPKAVDVITRQYLPDYSHSTR